MRKKTLFAEFIVLLLSYTWPAEAADHNAAGCSNNDIQAAISKAADGDRVLVPSGSCIWTGNVTIPSTKGITLQGSGPANTIITVNGKGILVIQAEADRAPIRVTGFRFEHTDTSHYIRINGDATDWRIDNNIFDDNNTTDAYTIFVWANNGNASAYTYGVIDHNQFINRNRATSIFIEWALQTDVVTGDFVWSRPAQRGTGEAVYIEDNTFSGAAPQLASQVVDCRWGCKYVLRYNTIHNPWISTHSACTNLGRDPLWVEIYKNDFTDDDNRYGGEQIEMRSVSGVIWDNDFAVTANKYQIHIDHERSYRSNCSGMYGGKADGTRSFDQNTSGQVAWRALGQPGWGPPQPGTMSKASFAGMFGWANHNNKTPVNIAIENGGGGPGDHTATHVQFGREIFNESHMTVGSIADRPSSCSAGPAQRGIYISTDENPQGAKIYQCSAPNNWIAHWEPYTYPHPLVSGSRTAAPERTGSPQ